MSRYRLAGSKSIRIHCKYRSRWEDLEKKLFWSMNRMSKLKSSLGVKSVLTWFARDCIDRESCEFALLFLCRWELNPHWVSEKQSITKLILVSRACSRCDSESLLIRESLPVVSQVWLCSVLVIQNPRLTLTDIVEYPMSRKVEMSLSLKIIKCNL